MEETETPLRVNKNNILMVGRGWEKQMNFLLAGPWEVMSTDAWNQHKFPKGRNITEKIDEDWIIAGDPKLNKLMRNTSPPSLGTCRLNISNGCHMKQLSGQLYNS